MTDLTWTPSFAKSGISLCPRPSPRSVIAASLGVGSSTTTGERPHDPAHRDAKFIRHADFEHNVFADGLGLRLNAAGYEVRADVLGLRGGQNWRRLLESALCNKARKVACRHGTRRTEVRCPERDSCNSHVDRSIDDPEFVLLQRLANSDAPVMRSHAQYIEIKRSWAAGIAEGEARGEILGRAPILSRLPERRSGSLPATVRERVRSASAQELDAWPDAVLDAPTLEAAFEDAPRH